MIKLLIVDDSALMRRHLCSLFEGEGGFEIQQARNGREAVELNRSFQPDVVSLDINMPEMDGITALSLIMAERPCPVVMVSSLTEKGALATFEALNLGAVDYVAKPGGTISLSIGDVREELLRKVRSAARSRPKASRVAKSAAAANMPLVPPKAVAKSPTPADVQGGEPGVVLIGVSTGGPRTLEDILPNLPADFPWPIVVAQHMPAAFTRPFAERLNNMCALTVIEASRPMTMEPGNVYVGKGGADVQLTRRSGTLTVMPRPENRAHLWHPSVEYLGRSALEVADIKRTIGVMLTGMGNDGADAFAEIKRRGGRTIAESEETAVVFGMPAELIERGGATMTLPSPKIAAQLNLWVER